MLEIFFDPLLGPNVDILWELTMYKIQVTTIFDSTQYNYLEVLLAWWPTDQHLDECRAFIANVNLADLTGKLKLATAR